MDVSQLRKLKDLDIDSMHLKRMQAEVNFIVNTHGVSVRQACR